MCGVPQHFHFNITLSFHHEIWWCENSAKVSAEMEKKIKSHKLKN